MLRILVIFIVVVVLGLHNLPLLVRDQAVIWLLDNGAETARLKALEIDWINGKVRIKGLIAEAKGKPKLVLQNLEVDLDYNALKNNRVLISALQLSGVELGVLQREEHLWLGPVDLNKFSKQPESDVTADQTESNWSFGLAKLAMDNIRWSVDLPNQKHRLLLNSARLSDFYLWDQQQPVSIDLDGMLNDAPFAIESSSKPLPAEKSSELKVQLKNFPVQSVTAALIPSLRGHIDLDLRLNAETNLHSQVTALKQSGSFRIRDFAIKQDGLDLKQQALSWKGDLKLGLKGTALDKVNMSSTVELAGLDLTAQGNKVGATDLKLVSVLELKHLKSLTAKELVLFANGINVESGGQKVRLEKAHVRGNVETKDLINWQANLPSLLINAIAVSAKDTQLIGLEKLQLAGFRFVDLNRVELDELSLDDLTVQGDEGVFTRWNAIKADSITLRQQNALSIDNLTLKDSQTRLILSPTRQLTDLDWLLSHVNNNQSGADNASTAEPAKKASPFQVALGKVTLSGDNPVSIIDQGVKPAFKTKLNIQRLALTDINTASKAKTDFELAAKNGFSTVSAKGAIELFSGNFGGHWDATIKGLDLPQVSPYSLQYTGYYMHSGQLSIDTKGTIKDRKLKGDMDIRLNKLEVEAQNNARSGEFDKKVSMPLGTAISILQDNDDNIDLQIPIDGSLDDPKFGYQTVINKLAGKGLKSAAMGYLSKALQPFGALISIGQMVMDAQEKGSFITLQPVYFKPAQSTLDGESRQYLLKLAGMMKERKGMRMNICGIAVPADKPEVWAGLVEANKQRKKPLEEEALAAELESNMQHLAEARSDQVKGELLNQGIDVERLFICYPKVNLQSDLKPQVALGL